MKILKNIFLYILILGCNNLIEGHEKIPSYLVINVLDGEVSVNFKSPMDANGKANVFITFPEDWNELSSFTSRVGKTEIKDMRFSGIRPGGLLRIDRLLTSDASFIISILNDGKSKTIILDPREKTWEIDLSPITGTSVFKSFTTLGVEHILMGIDHLLFVLALLFLVKGKKLIGAITAFTLAHSITLVISSLHILSIPSTVVEALIAFSIVLLAVEVIRSKQNANARNYIALAFFFGLLHGFGFAGALSDLGLPDGNLLMALFSFNVGVELGQLIFIGLALLMLPILFNLFSKPVVVKVCAYLIGSLGAYWMIDRTFGAWFV